MYNLLWEIVDNLTIGIIVFDKKQQVVMWNSWLERFSGIEKDQALGRNLSDVCPRLGQKRYQDIFYNAIYLGQKRFCSGALHLPFIIPADQSRNIGRQNMQVAPIYLDEEAFVLLQIFDITSYYSRVGQLKNSIRDLGQVYRQTRLSALHNRQMALHDSLTGLYNRRYFEEEMRRFDSGRLDPVGLLVCDVDGLKMVNDCLGHMVGDQLLIAVANLLKDQFRTSDVVARIGGDEFAILLGHCPQPLVEESSNRIRAAIQDLYILDGRVPVMLSLGYSSRNGGSQTMEDLFKEADRAMYQEKVKNREIFRTLFRKVAKEK